MFGKVMAKLFTSLGQWGKFPRDIKKIVLGSLR